MSSSDRRLLLEQKRKRLQELRGRRSKVSLLDVTMPNLDISEVEPARTKVDFAVQVDLIRPECLISVQNVSDSAESSGINTNKNAMSSSVMKFEKTVQTNFEDFIDLGDGSHVKPTKRETEVAIEPELIPPPVNEEELALEEERKVESSINEFLSVSGFSFSDLRLGKKHEEVANSDIMAPFHVTKTLTGFLDRPIVATALTRDHPDVFLVAYGKVRPVPRSKKKQVMNSPGLAVLFNKRSDTIVPEFFLECTSCICTIIFDRINPFKVFAGLENGRIVMWDLFNVETTQVAVLPTLQTTTVAANSHISPHKFIHHISPIVLLEELDTEMSLGSGILSICRDGVVNLWSPNLLVYPKIASIRLSDSEMGSRVPFRVTDALIKSAVFHIPGAGGYQNPPEYNFLDQTVLASENGRIYELFNSKEAAFIKSILLYPYHIEGPSAHGSSSIVELQYSATNTFIVSAHRDWSLKFWDAESGNLIHVSHTSTLVSKIISRPSHGSQFITIGIVRPPKIGLFVEFWDIRARLRGPISSIATREKQSGTVMFSSDGSEMILAYGDGEIDVFGVEETLLASQVKLHSHMPVEEGIEKLLSTL